MANVDKALGVFIFIQHPVRVITQRPHQIRIPNTLPLWKRLHDGNPKTKTLWPWALLILRQHKTSCQGIIMTWHGITQCEMAWHHMTWKLHMQDITWHDMASHCLISLHDMTFDDMASQGLYDTTPAQNKLSRHHHDMAWQYTTWHHMTLKPFMAKHDMTWHHTAWYHYLTWPMITWQDKARQYSLCIFHTIWVIQSELTCIIAACGLSQHPALDEDRSRHQTSNLR